MFKESQVCLRNPSDHFNHLLEVDCDRGNTASVEYGINHRSILDELQYFKVSSGALVSDILHDILEGALQYESKLLLRQFILQDRYFSVDQLNQMIESFDFGYLESKNRPSLINSSTLSSTDDNSLKQSGQLATYMYMCTLCTSSVSNLP